MIAFTGEGGVEHMIVNLLRRFVAEGIPVDLLLLKAKGRHLERIPPEVNVIPLDVSTSLLALPAVVRYLRRVRPACLLVAKDRASRIALMARRLAGVETRIVLRMGMHLSGSLAGKSVLRRCSRHLPVRWLYGKADRIITVSHAIAEDLAAIGGIPMERFTVVRNPSVPDDLADQAAAPVPDPWLAEAAQTPVILGAGRLTEQKDFGTLLRAFARLRGTREARLIILGDGPERAALEALTADLGIDDCVRLAGFQVNPYAWMARASLFVLSSRYEGSPNVLVEAMALGTPVVATDCPSGPGEILDHGAIAPLVPLADPAAMATAMDQVLAHPVDRGRLKAAVAGYHAQVSARQYLEALGYQV